MLFYLMYGRLTMKLSMWRGTMNTINVNREKRLNIMYNKKGEFGHLFLQRTNRPICGSGYPVQASHLYALFNNLTIENVRLLVSKILCRGNKVCDHCLTEIIRLNILKNNKINFR